MQLGGLSHSEKNVLMHARDLPFVLPSYGLLGFAIDTMVKNFIN